MFPRREGKGRGPRKKNRRGEALVDETGIVGGGVIPGGTA